MSAETGFAPVWDGESRVLILGSFPSVKSRAEGFYYGNPQNRFWRTVCGFFAETVPRDIEGKKDFLRRRHIALWDVVSACEIEGSSDASIRGAKIADVGALAERLPLRAVLCNGRKAYGLLLERFPRLAPLARLLPSTSPANPRFSEEAWNRELSLALEPFSEKGLTNGEKCGRIEEKEQRAL